jgi:hypothetical protein
LTYRGVLEYTNRRNSITPATLVPYSLNFSNVR